jgi:polysaccharide pyruvyl transferase WcaK-like protein
MFFKKVMFYGVSIDIQKAHNLLKIRKIFKGAYKVFVRDEASRKLLHEMKIVAHEIEDPVFHDNPLYLPKRKSLLQVLPSTSFQLKDLEHIDIQDKKIGIAFRSGYIARWKNKDVEVAKIWEMIHFLIGRGAKKILLLPHSFHKADKQANDFIFLRQFISSKVDICDSMEEVYDQYRFKKIDLCFAMRLHSIILSQVYSIPFIAFSYAQKTDEIIKKITQ